MRGFLHRVLCKCPSIEMMVKEIEKNRAADREEIKELKCIIAKLKNSASVYDAAIETWRREFNDLKIKSIRNEEELTNKLLEAQTEAFVLKVKNDYLKSKDDLDITINDNSIIIKGKYRAEENKKDV